MRFCRSLIDHTAIIIIIVTKGSTSKSTSAAHIKRRLGYRILKSIFMDQGEWMDSSIISVLWFPELLRINYILQMC